MAATVSGSARNDLIITLAKDAVVYGGDGDDIIISLNGKNRLYGGNGDDIVYGASGNDYLEGNGGNDLLLGGSGADTILGGTGHDLVEAGDGNDRVFGENGNDSLLGGRGDDYLDGGAGHDLILGQDGKDTLIGGLGNDTMVGGNGLDTFIMTKETGATDVIEQFRAKGADVIDLSDFSHIRGFGDIQAVQSGKHVVISLGGNQKLVLENVKLASLSSNQFIYAQGPANTAPTAVNDAAAVLENGSVIIQPLANDTDPDAGDTLTVTGVNLTGTLGTVTVTGNQFHYEAGAAFDHLAAGHTATDTFTYTIRDGSGATSTATVTVTVTGRNDGPAAATIANQTAAEDAAFTFTIPAGTFTDVDAGDVLTLSATLADGSALPGWLHFDAATGTFSGTPENGDVGAVSVRVTATDLAGATATTTFDLTVTNTNDAPVAGAIADQSATEDAAFTFTIPAGTFTDVDAGDVLTLSATLADGSALPGWLHFDAATGTFTGTPENGDVGAVSVRVTATDLAGATATSTFDLTVTNTNDAPMAGIIADQSANEDAAFSFTIPAGTFTDMDAGDTLTLTATLADGSALPGWLHFDAATGTFSGMPENGDVGAVSVRVTATDLAGATATSTFDLTVTNTNDAPVAAIISDQSTAEDAAFSFTIPAGTFTDVDAGDVLTLSATLADGSALPGWLHFDAATGTFSGTPENGDVGAVSVRVTATDLAGATATTTFDLTVTNTNDAPMAGIIADQAVAEDATFSFTIPAGTFTDVDAGDVLTLSATLADGSALPGWLHFDAATGTFSGTPENGDVGAVSVRVTATDLAGATATSTFDLTVVNVNDAPTAENWLLATARGQAVSGVLPFSDADAGDTATLSLVAGQGPQHGTVSILPDGRFTYTPAAGYLGSDQFTYRIQDAAGATADVTVSVRVGRDGLDTLVNTTTQGNQVMIDIAALADGNIAAVWAHDPNVTNERDLRVQVLDADGARIGSEKVVHAITAGNQTDPSIAALKGGGFIITWSDSSGTAPDTSNLAVRGQLMDAAGNRVGSEFLVNTTTAQAQDRSAVAALESGGFVVAWTDNSRAAPDTFLAAIRAQVFDAAGNRVGSEFLVNSTYTGNQINPAVTGLSNGGFIVTWDDSSVTAPDTTGTAIRAQIFNAAGGKVGSEFVVNTTTIGAQSLSRVDELAGGGFVITWTDASRTGGDTLGDAVRGQVFSAGGAKVGGEFLVNSTVNGAQNLPDVTALENGGFVIVWNDFGQNAGDTSLGAVRGQVFDASGARVGSEFLINTTTLNSQSAPSVTALQGGGFAVAWEDYSGQGEDPSFAGIRIQYFNADGSVKGLHVAGTEGNDLFFGGQASDTFAFDVQNGSDTVFNFTNGQDRLDLRAFDTTFAYLQAHATQVDADGNGLVNDVRIDLSGIGGGEIKLINLALGNLDGSDFIL